MRRDKVISEVLGAETILTPSEIYAQRFPKSLVGGYSVESVDEFLHRVADTVELLLDRIQELKEKIDEQTAIQELDFEAEKSEMKTQIEKFIGKKPEAVAQLLRSWLNE